MSPNAKTLLSALQTRPMHEQDAIKVLFPEPKYIGTLDPNFDTETKIKAQMQYWQWDVNLYGQPNSRPVNSSLVDFIPTADYSNITYTAFKELKDLGLVYSTNNGYNSYSYHLR